jgi:hypothetical protein
MGIYTCHDPKPTLARLVKRSLFRKKVCFHANRPDRHNIAVYAVNDHLGASPPEYLEYLVTIHPSVSWQLFNHRHIHDSPSCVSQSSSGGSSSSMYRISDTLISVLSLPRNTSLTK